MTTFEAVAAHWPRQPKPPRSTQRSKKSQPHKGSSIFESSPPRYDLRSSQQDGLLALSSPAKPGGPAAPLIGVKHEPQSTNGLDLPPIPVAPTEAHTIEADTEDESSDEEVNPFELFATTQASQGPPDVTADVNPNIISRANGDVDMDDVDEDELAIMQHERDARQHAEEGVRFRATQAPAKDDESDEYDDEELDELFRRTVMGGWSNQTTPRKRGGSMTPTTGSRSGMSSGGLEARRQRREARLMEQAGLGDLR